MSFCEEANCVAGPLEVGRLLRAFRQRSVANPNYGRISTKANLINDGVGNVLDQRLKVVSREPWLGVREPLGGVGRVCSHAVVVQGFSIPSHSEFAHVSLFACRTAACASRRHCTRRMDAVLPFRRWLLLLRRFGPLLVAIELACATSSPRRMTRRIGAPRIKPIRRKHRGEEGRNGSTRED